MITKYKGQCYEANQHEEDVILFPDVEINKVCNFHGIQCLISSKYDSTHYRLIALDGTTEQLQMDKSFTEYHEWGAIAVPIFCPSCKKVFWFDDTGIPIDRMYECECPNCRMLLKRKKVSV